MFLSPKTELADLTLPGLEKKFAFSTASRTAHPELQFFLIGAKPYSHENHRAIGVALFRIAPDIVSVVAIQTSHAVTVEVH